MPLIHGSTDMSESDPLLSVQNLAIEFDGEQGRQTRVVEGLSFDIRQHQVTALVGETGSGKSVTALSVLRLLDERRSRHPEGRILFQGEDLLQATERRMRQIRGDRISMIFQEPMTSLNPLHTVFKQINETLLIHKGLRGEKARNRIIELLDMVGIPDPAGKLNSYPHQLSGGQKQRIMIAMALANEPDLLIADEPTTALDVTVQRQVLECLKSLQERFGMAVLLITHDLSIVSRYADDVVVMKDGALVEKGPCAQVLENPGHDYTRRLIDATPGGSPDPVPTNALTLLEADNLHVRFPIRKGFLGGVKKHFHAVNDVSLQLRAGQTLGIVGESGSGKTTLGLALLKLIGSEGAIRIEGKAVDALNQKAFRPFRKSLQIVFQDPFGSLSPRMSVEEIVGEGLGIHEKLSPEERRARITAALKDVGLDPDSGNRYPHEFSGGQRQRIAIARALVLQPAVIVLDEPTSALDRTVQAQVISLLKRLQARYGLSYVFISHDLAVVRALSHELMVLKDGQIVEQGPAETLFSAPQHPYTQELLEAAFFYESDAS